MNITKKLFLVVILILIIGCQTTAINSTAQKTSTSLSNNKVESSGCGYNENEQPAYLLSELAKKYVTNSVRSMPGGQHDPQFINEEYFNPILENTFKFSLVTKRINGNDLAKDDHIFEINKRPYVYSGNEMVKVITSTCQEFWFVRGNYANLTVSNIKRYDGKELDIVDYYFILGEKNLEDFYTPDAEVIHDKFKNTFTINGFDHHGMMFRDWGSTKSGKLIDNNVQLYLNIKFRGDWLSLDRAYDEDANIRKVVKIDTNVDCSNEFLGCQLTETIGIEFPISYLEEKHEGFELKVAGKQERVVNVSSFQIVQILKAVSNFR